MNPSHIGPDFTALSNAYARWLHSPIAVDDEGKTRFAGLVSVFAQTR
jgi:hypothetical protein